MIKWVFNVVCIFFFQSLLLSQGQSLSIEIQHPITIDNNFVGTNYNGIIDVGAKYRFINLDVVNFGTALNIGLLTDPGNNDFGADFTVNTFYFQPKGFVELRVPKLEKLRAFVGVGISIFTFTTSGSLSAFEISGAPETQIGFNVSLGLSYDIFSNFFIQVNYDFSSLSPDDDVPDIIFNSNVNLLKLGVGYRFGS